MTDEIADAFRAAPGYHEQEAGVFEVGRLNFDGQLTVSKGPVTLALTVPTLDATVENETVAPVVEQGWEETFERRVEDVTNLVSTLTEEPEVTNVSGSLRVSMSFRRDSSTLTEEVRNAANYVEGTWVEGIIPGYEYEDQVQAIRERASKTASEE
ncbi:DUF5813 family protein [Halodesulfurarchaeum sp.]|uniref:DUF5813 family protein n=1 Tax=Halodesulfurarchaeum sp. TaxID=1980530 RepID=UPI001BBA9114|nr:hypothetical protein [Halodesulfurarchaeum sp.]